MAKARPIIPGRAPNSREDPPPNRTTPRPQERQDYYKKIGQVIIDEWQRAISEPGGPRELDRDHLQREISSLLRLDRGHARDPMGPVEIGVIVDPKPDQGRKFVWIVIPYPEAPEGMTTEDWIDVHNGDDELKTLLGEAILFGCGR